jgi:hypothetical protein
MIYLSCASIYFGIYVKLSEGPPPLSWALGDLMSSDIILICEIFVTGLRGVLHAFIVPEPDNHLPKMDQASSFGAEILPSWAEVLFPIWVGRNNLASAGVYLLLHISTSAATEQ